METIKTGAKWAVKGYLYLLLAMIAAMFVVGVLSSPFNALTGGGTKPASESCLEWGDC